MIYSDTAAGIETHPRALARKCLLIRMVIADSLEAARDRMFAFTRLDLPSGFCPHHDRDRGSEREIPPPHQDADRADAALGTAGVMPNSDAQG